MTGDPGLSSSRSDAGLVTCQVHEHATRSRSHQARTKPSPDRLNSPSPATPTARLSDPTSREDTPLAGRGWSPWAGAFGSGSAVLT